jgi:hypothetical protein
MTYGSYQPVAGGPTFNYKSGPLTLGAGVVANNQSVGLTVTAADPTGNSAVLTGTSVVGDGVAPTGVGGKMVSAYTNFYSSVLGYGEVPSDGTQQANGSFVYGAATDANGIARITANLDLSALKRLKTGATAVALASSNYTTYMGEAWSWRTAAQVIDTAIADGTRYYQLTASDVVGNATTTADLPVDVDDTGLSATGSSCAHAGNATGTLTVGDTSSFTFNDALWPNSILAGWTGTTRAATAIFHDDATSDFIDYNTDFGVTFLSGTTTSTAIEFGAKTWATANTNMPSSTFALFSPTVVRVAYGAPATAITNRNKTSNAFFGTTLRDAAGNVPAAGFTLSCATTAW